MLKRYIRKIGCAALMALCAFSSIIHAKTPLEQNVQAELEAAVADALNLNLNLNQYSVQRITTDVNPDARSGAVKDIHMDLTLDGRPVQMSLSPHSVRSPNLVVYTVDGDGVKHEFKAPPIRTYQGSLKGMKDAKVAASVTEGGQVRAWIQMPDEIWAVQPLSDATSGIAPDLHVVYRTSDILPGDWTCGADEEPFEHMLHGISNTLQQSLVTLEADVAFDADTEYYNLNGSSVSATIADIESTMNAVELIYLNETDIGYAIGRIIVRTGADPYSSTNPSGLLSQFRSEWRTNQAGVPRDVAHLMTGKNLAGSVIGIAYLNGVCSFNVGYGVSQSRFSGNFASRVALTAHELGHNWSANHCNGQGDCAIMCSGIGGCTGLLNRFGVSSENAITSWANSVGCLSTI
ncbi:M12 family metallo-peptidase [uncultured Microbulbifer sp.]|uniref:M12 family metallo-peptidase n=1 Tax=uncultured Microbulbifer sp. TaxID=348147 RepID=UPI002633E079|nr:M12 family metallo-peptidase [uncultured Microbulbifer sp.]